MAALHCTNNTVLVDYGMFDEHVDRMHDVQAMYSCVNFLCATAVSVCVASAVSPFFFSRASYAAMWSLHPHGGPQVHGGFQRAYDAVHMRVLSLVEELTSTGAGPWEVYVTGHSLGGALATLCAYELATRRWVCLHMVCVWNAHWPCLCVFPLFLCVSPVFVCFPCVAVFWVRACCVRVRGATIFSLF